MRITDRLERIINTFPTLTGVILNKIDYAALSFELQQMQRFGNDGPYYVMGPFLYKDLEVWREREHLQAERGED